jgi:hypothetical protein
VVNIIGDRENQNRELAMDKGDSNWLKADLRKRRFEIRAAHKTIRYILITLALIVLSRPDGECPISRRQLPVSLAKPSRLDACAMTPVTHRLSLDRDLHNVALLSHPAMIRS